MNSEQQGFLQAAEIQKNCGTDFMSLVPDMAVCRVHGADAATFLQNQLSNDINLLQGDNVQLSGYCTPKGRLLALFTLFKIEESYYLIAPDTVVNSALERLKKYVLMSQVEFTLLDYIHWGVCGTKAQEYLAAKQLSPEPWQLLTSGNIIVLALPGTTPRYHLLGPESELARIFSDIQQNLPLVAAACWHIKQIQSGHAQVFSETVEQFIPQMLNLQVMNGLSFKKGCYPGQEIVARTQYRGTLKRRMHLARLAAPLPLVPGQELWVHDEQFDKDEVAGNVVMSACDNESCQLLAVIQNKYVSSSGGIHVTNSQGPEIEILPLPYSLDVE